TPFLSTSSMQSSQGGLYCTVVLLVAGEPTYAVFPYTTLFRSGLVAAAGIAVLIVQGGAEAFRWAFLLMLVATVISRNAQRNASEIAIAQVVNPVTWPTRMPSSP